jgi:hypothetical protein
MMDSALAVRAYTASEIAPLLSAQMQHQFLTAERAVLPSDTEFPAPAREPS